MPAARSDIALAPVAWVMALAPLVTAHLTWLLSTAQGHIEPCIPYGFDCHSISATGRDGAAYFVFKAGMLPAALALMLAFRLAVDWLRSLGVSSGRGEKALPWMGLVAGLALLLYTLVLGHEGDTYHLLRRIGVVLYFALTWIGLVLISARLRLATALAGAGWRLQLWGLFTLTVAVVSLVLDASLGAGYDRMEDAFEWWLALLVALHGMALARLWQRSGFRGRLETG